MPTVDDRPRAALLEIIRQEIGKHPDGAISFADFMQLALYHPTLGYYCTPDITIGAKGDFTTAPEISSLFGQCLAQQIIQIMQQSSLRMIYEFGAGTGKLALDILTALNAANLLPEHYYIFEISPALRDKQKAFLTTHCPQWLEKVTWLDDLPEVYDGIVIANEVLDALPVNIFSIEVDGIKEQSVAMTEDTLSWQATTSNLSLLQAAEALQQQYELPPGYRSEICLALNDFLADTIGKLKCGIVLLFDYGYGQREYYHPERYQGTLTCFYQHHRHDNPLLSPGLQDITAHVDFTRVIEIASALGFSLAGFTTQSAFLLDCDLVALAAKMENSASTIEQFAIHQAIKILTMPMEMGELIKVMALSKQCDLSLRGFQSQDRCRDL